MKPDSDFDEFVDALRSDLPSAEREARLRARLAAIAAVGVTTLASSTAAAAGLATKGAVSAGIVARIGALSWGAKLGLASAVCATAAAGPLVLSRTSPPPAPETVTAPHHFTPAARTARPSATQTRERSQPPPAAEEAQTEARPASSATVVSSVVPPARERGMVDAWPRSGRVATAPGPMAKPAAVPALPAVAPPMPVMAAPTPTLTVPVEPPTAVFPVPAAPAVPANSDAALDTAATTLRKETLLIDRALAATRDGNLARARQLLDEHEQLFPNGLLRRERERARTKLAERSTSLGKP